MLVCAVYELFMCSKMLDSTLFGLYHWGLGLSAAWKLTEHKNALRPLEPALGINLDECPKQIKTLRDFDRLITSRVHGYQTPDNYYRQASVGQHIHKLHIPTLLLSPLDDPVVPYPLL